MNNNSLTTLLTTLLLAHSAQANILDSIGLKKLSYWWAINLGLKPWSNHRLDDKSVADYVVANTGKGRSLIIRGNLHIFADGKATLRRNLPGNLTIMSYDPANDLTGQKYGKFKQTAERIGRDFNPPDYTLDFQIHMIQPYARTIIVIPNKKHTH